VGLILLNVYLVSRTDDVRYGDGEWADFVVVAKDEESAFNLAKDAGGADSVFKRDKVEIKKIDLNEESVILGSFTGD
jgi:hypothetical protein